MQSNDKIRIRHMIDAAKEAMSFAADRSRKDLDTDRMLVLSLVKSMVGDRKSEVSSRRSGVGELRAEGGSQQSDVGSRMSSRLNSPRASAKRNSTGQGGHPGEIRCAVTKVNFTPVPFAGLSRSFYGEPHGKEVRGGMSEIRCPKSEG